MGMRVNKFFIIGWSNYSDFLNWEKLHKPLRSHIMKFTQNGTLL